MKVIWSHATVGYTLYLMQDENGVVYFDDYYGNMGNKEEYLDVYLWHLGSNRCLDVNRFLSCLSEFAITLPEDVRELVEAKAALENL
jgi:hypothetical protein